MFEVTISLSQCDTNTIAATLLDIGIHDKLNVGEMHDYVLDRILYVWILLHEWVCKYIIP